MQSFVLHVWIDFSSFRYHLNRNSLVLCNCVSCPCWIFMQLLRSLQEVNHLQNSITTIESLCPAVVSDLNMLSKWTYQLCSGSFWPFHTLNWNKWQICTCHSCSPLKNHWIQQEKLEDSGWSSMEMASKVDLISGPRMLCILSLKKAMMESILLLWITNFSAFNFFSYTHNSPNE